MLFGNSQIFLEKLFTALDNSGINYSEFILDHIAYKFSTPHDYEKGKIYFGKENTLISEHIFGGIHVSVFKLNKPIHYSHNKHKYIIDLAEIIEPKNGEVFTSSLEHIEFVPNMELDKLVSLYPQLDWDTSSINREQLPAVKVNFGEGIVVKFPVRGILETLKREGKI